jgi:hypothetical protein
VSSNTVLEKAIKMRAVPGANDTGISFSFVKGKAVEAVRISKR